MAYGSTEEKAASRALGRGSSAEAHTVMPTAGCVCTAAAHDGKPHAMFVSFPAMPGVPEQCFAFATSAVRDSFMRAVQAKSISLAAPSTSSPPHVAAEAHHPAGGDALAEVTCPTLQPRAVDLTLQRAIAAIVYEQLTSPSVPFLTVIRRCCGSIYHFPACRSIAAVACRCQRRHQRGCAL
jgi:hypothetical protein